MVPIFFLLSSESSVADTHTHTHTNCSLSTRHRHWRISNVKLLQRIFSHLGWGHGWVDCKEPTGRHLNSASWACESTCFTSHSSSLFSWKVVIDTDRSFGAGLEARSMTASSNRNRDLWRGSLQMSAPAGFADTSELSVLPQWNRTGC